MTKIIALFFVFVCLGTLTGLADNGDKQNPEFSVAGYFDLPNSGREVFNFNVGWRFVKTNVEGAHVANFDDSSWEVVNLPHGLELLPSEASGCINYQGPAWYRKHFTADNKLEGKQLMLHFEGIMGKSKIWLNGELVKEHFGGYLPVAIDVTNKLKFGEENVVAVWADNSDDPIYPPGKPQNVLDFSYFGGIYRDSWLIATNDVHISNANYANKVAGGGLFIHTESLTGDDASVVVQADVINGGAKKKSVVLELFLKDTDGNVVLKQLSKLSLAAGKSQQVSKTFNVKNAHLWDPDDPYLYNLEARVKDKKGNVVDGVRQRVGIRTIEFRGREGFFLNGKSYHDKLIGANRHQDCAYVGNALPNVGQWRDVKKLRDAGMRIIRAAHYPVDPALMDACDELGLFYIVATPGWQFWNKEPIFKQRVYSDIRNMVRRDRNHACVLMWEPILNETWYPDDFAGKVHSIVHEEYPFPGAYTVCDNHARGAEHFDVVYSHPFRSDFYRGYFKNTPENAEKLKIVYAKEDRSVFTREWGDCVDDWSSHNSPSRVARNWGEHAQLVQAKHYGNPDYVYTSWESLYRTPKQHIGGALWHSFDHQRGYHPDPFYGGVMDMFRQPKYSYYLFASQRDPKIKLPVADSGPMIYIAHEMTPFSEPDVTVFTNCDEVRLIVYEKDTLVQKVNHDQMGMPHPPVVFKDVFNFLKVKSLHRSKKAHTASFVAEGLIDGKVVATYKKMPAKKATKVKLTLDNENVDLLADGSDVVTIIASITDDDGNVKRLNNYSVHFDVEGEGVLVDDGRIGANPRKVEWGTAPAMIRATNKAGQIIVKARVEFEGALMPVSTTLKFRSIDAAHPMIYTETAGSFKGGVAGTVNQNMNAGELQDELLKLRKELNKYKLKEVEKQQEEFEGSEK
ncbi:glycoside hydrolase family 2 protein [Puteibacter caeruleilacunae]|nr:glycoside hydrolase family 2 protein [Puteibacter caeruleilacunae]